MSTLEQEQLLHFIRFIATASANAALYNLKHQQVMRLCRQAHTELQPLFETHADITLKVVERQAIFANRPLPDSLTMQRLISALEQYNISHLRIFPGVSLEELLELINILSKRPEHQVALAGSEHIHFSQIEIQYRSPESMQQCSELLLTDIANKEAGEHMGLYRTAKQHQPIDIGNISDLVNRFVNGFMEYSDIFLALAPLRSMDEYTYTHSTNICLLNLAQARQLGIEGQLLNEIGIAAMLHDVGKMFVPPDVLSKKGQLTDEEWQIMQQHPRLGAEYLLSSPGVPRLAVVTAYEHHMQYNGEGYPKTSQPWTINICSHMTAISDTYDAMRTRRSYEESLELEKISEVMIKLAGTKLHPQLTYNFLQLLFKLEKGSTQPIQ